MTYLMLILGFILLVKGADWFVDGSSSVAKLLNVPSVVIGLTIVAMGTSAPEAAVSITAGLSGNNDIAISNVIGSNLFNLLMVVGVCAIIMPFVAEKDIIKRDYPFSILMTLLVWFFIRDQSISQIEGITLLVCMIAYISFMIFVSLRHRSETGSGQKIEKMSPMKSTLLIIIGMAAIIFGGDLVVDNASTIASTFGLSQTLIGLTIVAIGTSLPELATSFVAARKGESELALGNVVGSNLFNLMFILGSSASLSPISIASATNIDIILLLIATVLTYIFILTDSKVSRKQGIIGIMGYIAYTVYIIMR